MSACGMSAVKSLPGAAMAGLAEARQQLPPRPANFPLPVPALYASQKTRTGSRKLLVFALSF